MNRIKKFIKNKPSKNHRIIEYNNKEYKITKKDVQDIRLYKRNKCLTELDLYMPLNTAFSRETRDDALNAKINKRSNREQTENFVKRMKKYEKKMPVNVNEITNIWDDMLDAKHSVEIELKPLSCKYNEIQVDEKTFMRKIEDEYFCEPVVKHKIENILPQMPRQQMSETVSELAMYYKFTDTVRYFAYYNSKDKFCVVFENKCAVYEFANKRLIAEFDTQNKIVKVLCNDTCTIIAHGKCVTMLYYRDQKFEIDENKYVTHEHSKKHITIEHKDTIKDITCNSDLLCVISGRNILIHDIANYKTVQPLRLKTEIPIKIKTRNNELLITTCNAFYIYNLKEKAYTLKMSSLFTFPHAFDFVNDYLFIVDKQSRITILKDNKLIKMMEQQDDIKNIVVHRELNQFVVLYKEKYCIFGYDEYGTKLLKAVEIKTRKIMYHENLNWIYMCKNNQLQIYT